MREIKFRVFNKTTKTMHYCDLAEVAQRSKLAEMILIQYTGLKDKKGNEIYEGDIISPSISDICQDNFEVYFDNNEFAYRLARRGDKQYDKTKLLGFAHIGEVIGNIYETPELLK
jgi:uncharacterized phage protein (TIGR01671 family)